MKHNGRENIGGCVFSNRPDEALIKKWLDEVL
jgi:hypothetical protein